MTALVVIGLALATAGLFRFYWNTRTAVARGEM